MKIAQVVGTVVSTIKVDEFKGRKLLIVQPFDEQGKPRDGQFYVAIDAVGAGAGELVLVAHGSAARHTNLTPDMASDAAIVAIVDSLEVAGEFIYRKS